MFSYIDVTIVAFFKKIDLLYVTGCLVMCMQTLVV